VKGGGGIYGVSKDPSGGGVGGGGRGGTREGSRLGSRGHRRHTMGTALYMHVYYTSCSSCVHDTRRVFVGRGDHRWRGGGCQV